MLYPLLRPLLFKFDAETAHEHTLKMLDRAHRLHLTPLAASPAARQPVQAMGLTFPNPVGLAAGLDKNGAHIDALAALGFGFIEIGTVTPRPQDGNPKPRLFRLPEHEAIINRMGFNNHGVAALLDNVRRSKFKGVLGINIGKNAITPIENAVDDYLACLDQVYAAASYVTVNISSPNTKNLRQLQQGDELGRLLAALKQRQLALADQHGRYVPLAVKIAPDLDDEQIAEIARLLTGNGIDGVIATNTTLSRREVAGHPLESEAGGLSGAPVRARSTEVIRKLHKELGGAMPIIGVGGILSGNDAVEKLDAGASLVQLYSGLIYRGPELVGECARATAQYLQARN
ncbi:quinone-dependent dihydroorotate dehydrogenase [Chromobacterium violaceum]|uniref:Dihydroorotate dehydrogenase (quinone) n=2 Tax=Chromobacterium violaceum TaxID=536 RepID=PYRD_CHRVO|nr:quinone-dependent dihydroorotate dehydrogenase [Chromobacterium violaceum]Q7NX17.1 RecName: Full=Dihydroorotate dehydrogenase (quinone); AltName: Full=DHOdehase; Short=DHOD; Short=DHODase; AltName: Full=Dihydroorotate oxidase [Chromobacterium violaceum ATCC 12472]AAQ59486.1 dihydroorotate oxidase [Chromobacterium violaceum ATCC 12472]ATP28418.1 dihydroorotate dehydrogenase (quinone) [Chromobacterium violaceum]ATP32327.1 dihydroorotate dehydrogenase (quinone) [Chromobacterium violaceum]KJH67